MAIVKCQTVVNILEELAPRKLAESWDNVGLLVGDGRQEVKKVMVCLDVPEWVVDEAVSKNVDMIIAHHPIIFSGMKKINNDNVLGRKLLKLIKNNISVYCTHTNYDIVKNGLNDAFADLLGFEEHQIIEETTQEKLLKLAVYVPQGYELKVMEAMSNAGAGFIGAYSHCSFRTNGVGTFKPTEGAKPFIGEANKLEEVQEYKLETIVPEKLLSKVLRDMQKVHPYEEVAYDIYELANKGKRQGVGRLVVLEHDKTLMELAEDIKQKLGISTIRLAGDRYKSVRKLALLNGAGNKFVNSAYFSGAQVLITGDMQYHEILDAVEMGISVIDAGHYATEKLMSKKIAEHLIERFNALKYDVEVFESETNIDPVLNI